MRLGVLLFLKVGSFKMLLRFTNDFFHKILIYWQNILIFHKNFLLVHGGNYPWREEEGDSEKYLGPCKTSKMERFFKIVNKISPSAISPQRFLTQFWICLCLCMLDAAFGFWSWSQLNWCSIHYVRSLFCNVSGLPPVRVRIRVRVREKFSSGPILLELFCK